MNMLNMEHEAVEDDFWDYGHGIVRECSDRKDSPSLEEFCSRN